MKHALIPAAVACTLLASAGLTHLYWAVGGATGKTAAIPSVDGRPLINPSPRATAAVGLVLFAAAFVVAAATTLVQTTILSAILDSTCILLTLVFAMRAIGDFRYVGFFKRIKQSRFARLDTYLYSPLCLLLSILIGIAVFA